MKIGVTHLFKNEFAEAESVFLSGINAQPSTDPYDKTSSDQRPSDSLF
jgi:hypothetical protein